MTLDGKDDPLHSQILLYDSTRTMTDRERAQVLGLPEGCRIREGAKILCPEKFKCGHHVWIGEGAILDAQGGLSIGDFTQIGLNVMLWSHTSIRQARHAQTCVSSDLIMYSVTSVGNRCWIGGPSVIYPGVKIGDRVVVMPFSVVDRDIPDGEWVNDNYLFKGYTKRLDDFESRLTRLEGKDA